jgi:phenylpropionate dioxygenase-like ring-hydroxylating dioxygenase large terminal subunit
MSFWNQCNWKLSTEQAMDMYHVPDTHFMAKSASRVGKNFSHEGANDHWALSYSPLERMHPFITGTNQNETAFPAIEGLGEFELSTFNLLHIYPSTILGLLPHGALTFFIRPEGVGRTNVVLNLWFTEAGFAMDDYEEALRDAQEGLIVTNNQDMYAARLVRRGMKSHFLSPGRFSYLEQTTWALDRYVIKKVTGLG